MRFNIPQFIDIEDKLFGNLTFKQFIYVVGGVAWGFIMWRLFPAVIAILFATPVIVLAGLLAFKPVGGRPFSVVLESGIKYLFGNKLYLWKKEEEKETKKQITSLKGSPKTIDNLSIPRVDLGKLDNLSWSLDVHKNETSEK